jgi:hypothetical protein
MANLATLRPHKKGEPRKPGSGRKKGTPNRAVVAAKELCGLLVHDVNYQYRLRKDFAMRRVHPSIEALVWAYGIGKPKETLELSGQLDVSTRLTAERELIRNTLDLSELETLAAQSQAVLDAAITAAKARRQLQPPDIDAEAVPAEASGQ